jgi:CheY-like chemotaxis protein
MFFEYPNKLQHLLYYKQRHTNKPDLIPMKVLIVEDEQPAFFNLAEELHVIDEKIDVVAGCSSVEETVRWLNDNPHPDLILMDVQLSDGLSFSIFKNCKITCPVIFTTAYNEYLTEAFRFSSIDYLLKPISSSSPPATPSRNTRSLQAHFVGADLRYTHNTLADTNTHPNPITACPIITPCQNIDHHIAPCLISWADRPEKIPHPRPQRRRIPNRPHRRRRLFFHRTQADLPRR